MSTKNVTVSVNGDIVGTAGFIKWIDPATTYTVTTDTQTDYITVTDNGSAGGGAVGTDVLWDTKGDLAVASGANAASKLAVGTNGQVLAADSTQTLGVKWATLAGNIIPITFAHSGVVTVTTESDTPPPFRWYNDTGVTLTLTKVRANATIGPNGSTSTIDINADGTTVFSSTKLVLPNNSGAVSTITAVAASMTTSTIADGHYLSVNVDTAGGGAMQNLLVTIVLTG